MIFCISYDLKSLIGINMIMRILLLVSRNRLMIALSSRATTGLPVTPVLIGRIRVIIVRTTCFIIFRLNSTENINREKVGKTL